MAKCKNTMPQRLTAIFKTTSVGQSWNMVHADAHARAFNVAAGFPAAPLQAMEKLVHSLAVSATPWPIAKTALQQACDALAAVLPEGAPA
jgi:hypothetical protein